uniref:Uncharacterized protein n=1 Tax=Rhizophora mucronata TaxID=61149 RepID=A0A2P2QGL7_RHIMU
MKVNQRLYLSHAIFLHLRTKLAHAFN